MFSDVTPWIEHKSTFIGPKIYSSYLAGGTYLDKYLQIRWIKNSW